MRHIRQCLFVLGMLAVAVVNLVADVCNPNGSPIIGLNVCWILPLTSTSGFSTNPVAWCSPAATTQCGYFYTNTTNGWNSLGLYGWHGYSGTGSAQSYLNGVTNGYGMSIQLSNASSLYTGFVAGQHRNPSGDNGYYISTANSTNTPGITIHFASPVKDFAMYWGSVDMWNTVTFTDTNTNNNTHIFAGSQMPNYPSKYWDPNGNNTTSILVHFSVPSGGKPWTQITFSSCGPPSVCKPAFEFDNLEWVLAPSNCCSVTTGTSSPIPEPSALMLLGTGFAGVVGWLRRRGAGVSASRWA